VIGVIPPPGRALLVSPVRAPLALASRRPLARLAPVHVSPIARPADRERPLAPLATSPKSRTTRRLQTPSPPGSTSRSVR